MWDKGGLVGFCEGWHGEGGEGVSEVSDDDEESVCGFLLSLFRKDETTLSSVGFWYGLVNGVGFWDPEGISLESRSDPQLMSARFTDLLSV